MSSKDPLHYVRIAEGEALPDLSHLAPYRAVVVLEADYGAEWQNEVSAWLVGSGCLYMMAWGPRCSSWDDSVDWANRDAWGLDDIPDEQFIMTTWHDHEALEEVFWFAGFCADHGDVQLRNTIIVHVSSMEREEEMISRFKASQEEA